MIYLDHAATTKPDKEVVKAMQPYFNNKFGNPNSLYKLGQEAKETLEEAREKITNFLNVKPNEIIFTSGGSESNNLVLKGINGNIVTSKIEHHATLEPCKYLEKQGRKVIYLDADKDGFINLKELEKSLTKDVKLVSIMHSNNEIGTIQDINEIGKICHEHNVLFHTDAVQSLGKIKIDLKNVDFASFSAHKTYGPRGVGVLYIREGLKLEPLIHGGGQERKLRSGTENVAGAVGFAKALEICNEKDYSKLIKLRDKLIKGILEIDNSWLNGSKEKRLPNNINVSFKFIEGESLVLHLDEKGICASTGSACSSKSLEPSHVLLAIGLKPEEAHGSLRLTLGRENTIEEVDYTIKVVKEIVKKLRKISPLK